MIKNKTPPRCYQHQSRDVSDGADTMPQQDTDIVPHPTEKIKTFFGRYFCARIQS